MSIGCTEESNERGMKQWILSTMEYVTREVTRGRKMNMSSLCFYTITMKQKFQQFLCDL